MPSGLGCLETLVGRISVTFSAQGQDHPLEQNEYSIEVKERLQGNMGEDKKWVEIKVESSESKRAPQKLYVQALCTKFWSYWTKVGVTSGEEGGRYGSAGGS